MKAATGLAAAALGCAFLLGTADLARVWEEGKTLRAAARELVPVLPATPLPDGPATRILYDASKRGAPVAVGRGGEAKAAAGGAVITDAAGRRWEIAASGKLLPAAEPRPARAPAPALPLEARRRRAFGLLGASGAGALLLLWWARRWKPA